MKQRFEGESDADSPHNIHDSVVYRMHEDTLMRRYEDNKELVLEQVEKLIQDIPLEGQWSMDIMQNGTDFYVIDMALAAQSALVHCVPKNRLKVVQENWIPEIEKSPT